MTKQTKTGRWQVQVGISYRTADGWARAEPGDTVDDLERTSDEEFAYWREAGIVTPADTPAPRRRAS